MSTDKRSVATDATATIGTILDGSQHRDAIHVAVEPVVAAHYLLPGQRVGRYVGSDGRYGRSEKPLGIVDPFLTNMVSPGERFWLCVFPRQITSLRHVWEHPDFPAPGGTPFPAEDDGVRAASEAWLRAFADASDCPGYEALIRAAVDGNNDGEYLHFDGSDAHGPIPPEFWGHVEVVTGKAIGSDKRATYFSCSC